MTLTDFFASARLFTPIRRQFLACMAALVVLLVTRGSFAQTGSVNGHIVDIKGASIQDVQVSITNTDTKLEQAVKTNGAGYFLFPPLTPGQYVLKADSAGFAEATIDGIVLEVAGSRTFDLTMKPEGSVTSITVSAAAPELTADNEERGSVIESQFVENTPLNIRNPLQLVNFAVGVTAYSSESCNNDQSEAYTESSTRRCT